MLVTIGTCKSRNRNFICVGVLCLSLCWFLRCSLRCCGTSLQTVNSELQPAQSFTGTQERKAVDVRESITAKWTFIYIDLDSGVLIWGYCSVESNGQTINHLTATRPWMSCLLNALNVNANEVSAKCTECKCK